MPFAQTFLAVTKPSLHPSHLASRVLSPPLSSASTASPCQDPLGHAGIYCPGCTRCFVSAHSMSHFVSRSLLLESGSRLQGNDLRQGNFSALSALMTLPTC